MPLCPQIVITPITVTTTGMTTTSIIPIVAATTEEVDELQTEIDTIEIAVNGKNKIYRQPTAPDGSVYPLTEGDIWFDTDDGNKQYYWTGTAWVSVQDNAIATAQATADSKIKTFYQTSPPTATGVGDIWFDTDDGNKQYFWNGTAWVSVQDLGIAAAEAGAAAAVAASAAATAAATAAQTTADGKNKIYRQATAPTGTLAVGDLWFNTAEDNKPNRWNGTAWEAYGFGNLAIGNLDAQKITTGFLAAGRIQAASLDATVLVAGSITAAQISAGTITATQIAAGTITASQIAASTITGSLIAAGTITASNIAATTITAEKIATGTITATQIAAGTITASQIQARSISGDRLEFLAITANEIDVETITAAEIAANSITVDRLTAGTLTAFTLRTSSGARRVTVSASTNSISFTESSTTVGHIGPASVDGIVMHYGSTFNPNVTTYPNAYVSSGDARIAYNSTTYVQTSSAGVVISGNLFSISNFYNQDTTTTTNAANTWMSSTNGLTRRSTASSQRYKQDIVDIRTIQDLDPKKLLDLPVRAFRYKSDYLDSADDRSGSLIPGFIAEEVATAYSVAADQVDGVIESWNDRYIVPGLLALIQDLHTRIEILEGNNA